MNWVESNINLGVIKARSKNLFSYRASKDLDIVKVSPGCGSCTKVKYNNKAINVVYTPDNIPKHIAAKQNFQIVTKIITVRYGDGTEESLTFTAKIVK